MEKDLKNVTQKMISSTTDQKDDPTMNEGGTGSDSSTTHQKEVSGGDNAAMNLGGAKMDQQKESGDDDVALNVGGTGSDSSTSHQKDVSSGDDVSLSDSSTLLLPKKRKSEWVLVSGTSSKKRNGSPPDEVHTMNLDAGEDVVDAMYLLSQKYDHRRFVNVISVTGSVSDVSIDDEFGVYTPEGIFQITSLFLSCLTDEDGRHCRKHATCSISLTNDNAKPFESETVNSFVAQSPIKITAAASMEQKKKSSGESSSAAAQDGNSDSKKATEELESLPTTSPTADGNINPATTSATNDQDKKSPSE